MQRVGERNGRKDESSKKFRKPAGMAQTWSGVVVQSRHELQQPGKLRCQQSTIVYDIRSFDDDAERRRLRASTCEDRRNSSARLDDAVSCKHLETHFENLDSIVYLFSCLLTFWLKSIRTFFSRVFSACVCSVLTMQISSMFPSVDLRYLQWPPTTETTEIHRYTTTHLVDPSFSY